MTNDRKFLGFVFVRAAIDTVTRVALYRDSGPSVSFHERTKREYVESV